MYIYKQRLSIFSSSFLLLLLLLLLLLPSLRAESRSPGKKAPDSFTASHRHTHGCSNRYGLSIPLYPFFPPLLIVVWKEIVASQNAPPCFLSFFSAQFLKFLPIDSYKMAHIWGLNSLLWEWRTAFFWWEAEEYDDEEGEVVLDVHDDGVGGDVVLIVEDDDGDGGSSNGGDGSSPSNIY